MSQQQSEGSAQKLKAWYRITQKGKIKEKNVLLIQKIKTTGISINGVTTDSKMRGAIMLMCVSRDGKIAEKWQKC